MKHTAISILTGVIFLSSVIVFSQQDPKQAYIKPELRNAITVTPKMLAPMRLAPGEFWFSAMITDPRNGEFKGGYLTYRFYSDGKGLQVLSAKNVMQTKVFSLTSAESNSSSEETFSPANGRILRTHVKGNASVMLSMSAPKSSVKIDKTADYDWNSRKIFVSFINDPKAPVREHALEDNTTSGMSLIAFMLKCKWTDPSKIYRFHYFDIGQETYKDLYVKCTKHDKNIIKYESVWQGWGEGGQTIFWVTLPKAGAPNGMFQKYIVDPMVSRYTTYKLTTKKEALKPVRPLVD